MPTPDRLTILNGQFSDPDLIDEALAGDPDAQAVQGELAARIAREELPGAPQDVVDQRQNEILREQREPR